MINKQTLGILEYAFKDKKYDLSSKEVESTEKEDMIEDEGEE